MAEADPNSYSICRNCERPYSISGDETHNREFCICPTCLRSRPAAEGEDAVSTSTCGKKKADSPCAEVGVPEAASDKFRTLNTQYRSNRPKTLQLCNNSSQCQCDECIRRHNNIYRGSSQNDCKAERFAQTDQNTSLDTKLSLEFGMPSNPVSSESAIINDHRGHINNDMLLNIQNISAPRSSESPVNNIDPFNISATRSMLQGQINPQ
ncbi:uncharacterized protein [Watersipora subatra]|uniref:uncharacterized protein n=1 Tax=Watersipora subatra TaxID=2589382 RepID=UPI00355C4987